MTNIKSNQFASQFNLFKTGEQKDDFYNNKASYIDSPTVYKSDITPADMYPNNQFNLLKDSKYINNLGNRRDNTILINNYHSNEVGQYARPKNETKNLFEPLKNENALAGSNKMLKSVDLNRFSQSLTNKNNEFPENTNIRPEAIDGIPLTELARQKEKTLDELRGNGVNSIRLDSKSRNNTTSFKGEGISLNPLDVNITKFKMKSYYDVDTDDLLKTTGHYIKPEYRSKVHAPSIDRTLMKQMIGPSKSVNSMNEYRNNIPARPTLKEEFIENKYISNVKSIENNSSYRNNIPLNPSLKEEFIENKYISNAKSVNDNMSYRNNMSAHPTIREDTINNDYISNIKSEIDNTSYRNNMSAHPTIREDTSNNNYISNNKSEIDNMSYRNNMSALPTIREETSNNNYISNNKSEIDNMSYRNNMSAQPTIREQFSENTYISNNKSVVDNTSYHNNMSAQPTIREDTGSNNYIGSSNNMNKSIVYENNNSSNPTLRDTHNNYTGTSYNNNKNIVYKNNTPVNPTIRDMTGDNNYIGSTVNLNKSILYENNMPANPTNRMTTEDNNYSGPSISARIYQKNNDVTRTGFVEDVLPKDYKGVLKNNVPKSESHLFLDTFQVNESIEKSSDYSKRDLMGGGNDQLPPSKKGLGDFTTNMKRDTKNDYDMNRVRAVTNSYIDEISDTRGKLLLEQRSGINQNLNNTLNGNPYINNMVHTSTSNNDIIRETTLKNTR